MCNGTWACFDCRTTVRLPTWKNVTAARPWLVGTAHHATRCGRCHGPLLMIGPTIEVPPRSDAREWRRLLSDIRAAHGRAVDRRVETIVRRRHELERRIDDLLGRPRSAGRDELIDGLKKFLASAAYADARHSYESDAT